jgi:type VI protein secretion system component VasK
METLIEFVPLAIISLVIGTLMAVAASKVGRSPVRWFIFGAIPFVNLIFIWIATWSVLVDLHRRLKAMETVR